MARAKVHGGTGSATEFIPKEVPLSLPVLAEAVQGCRGCELYRKATQAVFGRGPRTARVVLVGEQPGDQEDKQGEPFVGPAGRILDDALDAAGIDRSEAYVTNAVKHFKWEPRGKRRLHSKPSAREIKACRPWLEAELALLKPEVIVAMGATATQSLIGGSFRLTQHRGEFVSDTPWAPAVVTATVHPSAILRAPDREARRQIFDAFVADLRVVARRIHSPQGLAPGRRAQGRRSKPEPASRRGSVPRRRARRPE
jgi:DNA polymerase